MHRFKWYHRLGLAALAAGMIVSTPAFGGEMKAAGKKKVAEKWMIGDMHQHTYFTDGSHPMNDLTAPGTIAKRAYSQEEVDLLYRKGVMPQGFRFGLDFQANSEHGGRFGRDGFGKNWNTYSPNPIIGDGASSTQTNMWRWQSLISPYDIPGYTGSPQYLGAYDWIEGIRANYPQKTVMSGLEWNPPGHEHCTTGIISSNAMDISEFEFRFDRNDSDGTLTTATQDRMGWLGKRQNSSYTAPDYSVVLGLSAQHEKTMDAVRWMAERHPTTGWVIPAHVERAGCGVGAWSIASFRDMNDAAPTVAFGFEGIPGHEKASNRGELGPNSCGGGTYGGAGLYVAKVGGVWDNLLADGRKFYNFASSDFHNDAGADFWPGEYLKTYVKVKDEDGNGEFTAEEILNGLRSGNVFSVQGDIINELDFKVFHGASFRNRSASNFATMGETLQVKRGDKITVQIRFKTPETNNCKAGQNASAAYVCQPPSVHHVQLIQGRINPTRERKLLADGTPNPLFNYVDETVARIVAVFDADSWMIEDGYTTMRYVVPRVEENMFFRIRGTNLGYDVQVKTGDGRIIYGTDSNGSPLNNTPGTNNADMAWSDLWFYSNPIFVEIL